MDEDTPPSARALLPCLLPLDTLKKIRDQKLLVLEPVETLKELCREELTEEALEERFPWKEYRLHGKPQSLKEFLDLFLLENGRYDTNRAIWIPESNAFVCIDQWKVRLLEERLPEAFREGELVVELLSDYNWGEKLSILASTVEQAIPYLDFLFGLHDSHFSGLELSYHVPEDDEGEPPLCPLTYPCLEKLLLQNENRENKFVCMAFTPEQYRVLAGSGTKIGLDRCSIFQTEASLLWMRRGNTRVSPS
jgi:hypothetical protein